MQVENVPNADRQITAPRPARRWKRRVGAATIAAVLIGATPVATAGAATTQSASAKPASALTAAATAAQAPAAKADAVSCASHQFAGDAGAINVQTSPTGYVAWNIAMFDPAANAGPWVVDVYVGGRRVDHKVQDYNPHGSVHPNDAKPGQTFHITATHTDLEGNVYTNVPNECVIP